MNLRELPPPSLELAQKLIGTWWLLTREDFTAKGLKRIDPALGEDPIGILSFAGSHFSAQFMKRNRSFEENRESSFIGQNNTSAIAGYDAYFGTYVVNEVKGQSTHLLLGSINPSNVGLVVVRDMRITNDDGLLIQLNTTTREGEAIKRTLTWKRIG
jgi:hypothetical protein